MAALAAGYTGPPKLTPHTAAYNVPLSVRLPVGVDLAALRRACQWLLDRHTALRTTFDAHDGQAPTPEGLN